MSFFVKALVVCALLAVLPSAGAVSQENNSPVPLADLQEVLGSPDFGGVREGWGIRLKNPPAENEEEVTDFDLSRLPEWFKIIKEISGKTLRFILILALGALAVFLIVRLYKTGALQAYRPGGGREVHGIPREAAPDPRDLLEKARLLHARGGIREAWALCLRAAREAYTASLGIDFPAGATEYNCLAIVREAGEDSSGGFTRLVGDWIQFAYGGRTPPGGSFEQALVFCDCLLEKTHA
ncbi:MAG: hypothetical protein LBT68_01775 [Spirochaetales bacterium]|jgi:hypothetical protein|nr:hypothetical protein [Spirochaetales bacterium]